MGNSVRIDGQWIDGLARVLAAVLLTFLASGCFLWTTRGEGNELTERTDEQEERLQSLESGIREERERLTRSVNQAEAKVAELQEVLEQATAVVTRNSADLGLEVRRLREQIQALEGQIAELRNQVEQANRQLEEHQQDADARIQRIAQAAGLDVELDPSDIPQDKTDHFSTAYRAFQSDEHSRARALFREYVRRYPRDDQADNAQYWIGATYLAQERPATALGELRKVIADHGNGDAVDEALFDMADAFFQLRSCSDAQAALQALIRRHPRSPLVNRARRKLQEISRAPRDRCTN